MLFPVDPHTHTLASDHAYSTIHDYIAEARRKGIRLFANTDHGSALEDAPHYWHFINLRVVPRIVDGVGILRGIEANIASPTGEIDCTGQVLEALDIVLAGFHSPVLAPGSRAENTRAMIGAIRGGRVDIVTHPGNKAYPIDFEAVVRAAAECKVALEVNNSSFNLSRKGSEANCRAIVEAARDLGATLCLGSDAHISYSLGDFSIAAALVEEAGFPQERLLNTSPRRLLDFLESRGHAPIPEFGVF